MIECGRAQSHSITSDRGTAKLTSHHSSERARRYYVSSSHSSLQPPNPQGEPHTFDVQIEASGTVELGSEDHELRSQPQSMVNRRPDPLRKLYPEKPRKTLNIRSSGRPAKRRVDLRYEPVCVRKTLPVLHDPWLSQPGP